MYYKFEKKHCLFENNLRLYLIKLPESPFRISKLELLIETVLSVDGFCWSLEIHFFLFLKKCKFWNFKLHQFYLKLIGNTQTVRKEKLIVCLPYCQVNFLVCVFFLILKKSKKLETKKSEFPFAKKTLLLKKLKNLIEETVILEFLEFNSMILISLVIQRRT